MFAACLAGCAGSVPPSSTEPAPPSPPPVSAPVAPVDEPPPPAPNEAAQARAEDEPPPPAPVKLLDFEHVMQRPVVSIAVGNPPRVAVLSNQPWLLDEGGWQEKPLPARHAFTAENRAEIFFGRDNRPRLMGTTAVSQDGEGSEAIYLRLENAGWTRKPSEIGRLGGLPKAGLFGVLGHDDPEVVCKAGDICIIKRRSGWTMVPAGPGMPRVFMQDGKVWALHDDHVAVISDQGWVRLQGNVPWTTPTGLWGSANGPVWVSVAKDDALYRYESGAWTRMASPVARPKGLWGTSSSDVWVTGEDGAGHFDGTRWARVQGPKGPLSVVTGSGEKDVWLGGASGLWHGTGPEA